MDGIDANHTQGNNCGVTENPKEPPPDGERPAVFLFHDGRILLFAADANASGAAGLRERSVTSDI